MLSPITVIRNCAWAITRGENDDAHAYRQDIDIAFSQSGFLHVGPGYAGASDVEIDGRRLMAMPGSRQHSLSFRRRAIAKGLFEDVGTAALWGQCALRILGADRFRRDAKDACQIVMLADLMRSGVTTHLVIAGVHPHWLSLAAQSGLRSWLAPGFREAAWRMEGSHRLDYAWDKERGRERYAQALAFIEEARAHPSAAFDGVVAPSQIETCSEELLREAVSEGARPRIPHHHPWWPDHGRARGAPPPHRRDRATDDGATGVLGPDLIVGHCIFLDHHFLDAPAHARGPRSARAVGKRPSPLPGDLCALRHDAAARSAAIAAPASTSGSGPTVIPFNMLEEMREALICSRVTAGSVFDLDTGTLFDIATMGGARALGRTDIGRIAVGAKADLVLVDLDTPTMQPVHDPLRNLIHCAAERAVRAVFVDGAWILRDGKVMTLDVEGAVRQLQDAQRRACRAAEKGDPQRRPLAKLAPLSLPLAN